MQHSDWRVKPTNESTAFFFMIGYTDFHFKSVEWLNLINLYSELYTYPQLTLSPSESKHNSSKIIPALHLLGNSWWNLEDLRCSPARQYQYIVVIFRWKMIGFTRWMIPAAVNQTEMNIEISCANLKKCAFYILFCVINLLSFSGRK